MSEAAAEALQRFFKRFAEESELQDLRLRWEQGERAVNTHREALDWLGPALWRSGPDDELVALQQALYRELEQCLPAGPQRHEFVVVIPVADRPRHLEQCLGSLLELCRLYRYGGTLDGRYHKVSVLIAEDSAAEENVRRHREIAEQFTALGLATEHFGPAEQSALVGALPTAERAALVGVIGNEGPDGFHHKGASITRNIAYLRLRELNRDGGRRLFHFVDSDQEFKVRVRTPAGERDLYAINYFYWLDRLFSDHDIAVLTGKVVGDPPVSPSVMANNFLQDVLGFLSHMAELEPGRACSFHGEARQAVGDAAYHDMAALFGFGPSAEAYEYQCRLQGPHDHARCLLGFAERLNRFFDGEHLSRCNLYDPAEGGDGPKPARTIYTGNYCFNTEGLAFFIPFAGLRLRMAGPVLGRLLKAGLGGRFVSANLPMLHRRTVGAIGQSEFRPGIERDSERVDLSGEFERQFFGDLMLFTMERLTELGYPDMVLSAEKVEQALMAVETRMLELYQRKHAQILDKLALGRSLFAQPRNWWDRSWELRRASREIRRFFRNMEYNFGPESGGYAIIASSAHREGRRRELRDAILGYTGDREAWRAVMRSP